MKIVGTFKIHFLMRCVWMTGGWIPLMFTSIRAQQIEYLTPRLIDLGRVQETHVIEETIRFVNMGNKPITIDQVRTTCGCTAAQIVGKEVASGDTAFIGFTFNPMGYHGVIRKVITVMYEDKDIPEGKFVVQADVFSDLDVEPRFINFGAVQKSADAILSEYFTLENNSKEPIHCHKVYTSDERVHVSATSMVIQPGKTYVMNVTLKPENTGRHMYYVHIQTNNKMKPRINVPIFIAIQE